MNLSTLNEESVPDKKDEDISEKVMPTKHFVLKELWETCHDIEREKDTVLKANPNSEGRMTLSRTQETCSLCTITYTTGKSTVSTTRKK